ncbi:MAG TPA: ubiquinone biosynthesis protein UbiB, partial [Caulobacter sp.]|nr:ubiquinone biosynthesis protein UbiB [Caulobacter sp.]
ADPVVRRWISRELSPVARAKELADDAVRAIRAIARLAETQEVGAATVVAVEPPPSRLVWFALGAAVAG